MTTAILSATVVQIAVPYFVSMIVFNMYEALKPGQSLAKASLAAALAMAVALNLYGLIIDPLFSIIPSFGYSRAMQFIVRFFFIYIALMIALEKVARVRLDYCDTIIKAIAIPTIVVLFIANLGLWLTTGPPLTAEEAKEAVAVTEDEKAASEEEGEEDAPPVGKDAETDADSES